WTVHSTRRDVESRQLQRSPSLSDAAVGSGAGARRGLETYWRAALRRSRDRTSPRVVHRAGNADEPELAVRAGDSRTVYGTRDRNHRQFLHTATGPLD